MAGRLDSNITPILVVILQTVFVSRTILLSVQHPVDPLNLLFLFPLKCLMLNFPNYFKKCVKILIKYWKMVEKLHGYGLKKKRLEKMVENNLKTSMLPLLLLMIYKCVCFPFWPCSFSNRKSCLPFRSGMAWKGDWDTEALPTNMCPCDRDTQQAGRQTSSLSPKLSHLPPSSPSRPLTPVAMVPCLWTSTGRKYKSSNFPSWFRCTVCIGTNSWALRSTVPSDLLRSMLCSFV